jgi:hypothetical protein
MRSAASLISSEFITKISTCESVTRRGNCSSSPPELSFHLVAESAHRQAVPAAHLQGPPCRLVKFYRELVTIGINRDPCCGPCGGSARCLRAVSRAYDGTPSARARSLRCASSTARLPLPGYAVRTRSWTQCAVLWRYAQLRGMSNGKTGRPNSLTVNMSVRKWNAWTSGLWRATDTVPQLSERLPFRPALGWAHPKGCDL